MAEAALSKPAHKCPICGSVKAQSLIVPRFNWSETGHVWCRACGGTYDSNTVDIQSIFAEGKADPKTITDDNEYKKLFVETSNITGAAGTVYPRFKWDNNAEMQAAIAAGIAASIKKHLTTDTPRILDLGCGNGFTARGLGRVFGNDAIVGVDPSPTIMELTAEPQIECYQGTLDQIGFPDHSFDAVSIIGNLMLHPDPSKTLAEVSRVLKPGGIIVFDVKNIRSVTRLVARILARLSPRLARSSLLQRNFANMRFGLHRGHVHWLCPSSRFEVLASETKPPRLLAFSNQSKYTSGLNGVIWGLADKIDKVRDEQSWLQFTVRKVS